MALVINGEDVPDEVVYGEFDSLKQAAISAPNPPQCCEIDEPLMIEAKENVIARTLLNQAARKRGYAIPVGDVDEAFEKLKQEHGGEEWFYIHHASTKEQAPQFKETIELNLMVQRLLDEVCGQPPEPTDEDIEHYYQEHLDELIRPEQVHAQHIVKRLDHEEERAEAYKSLVELRRQLKDGADFAATAAEHSDQPDDGGDLGFFSRGELVEEFEAVVFSMTEGELSPVFLTQYGYHVAKLTARKASAPYPIDEVRDVIRDQIKSDHRHEATKKYVGELKSEATIEETETDEEDAEAAVEAT